jgi:hypothetical protein
MRWPAGWVDPAALTLLQGRSINFLLFERGGALEPVVAEAQKLGISVGEPGSPPAGVTIIKGEWPGVEVAKDGAVIAGPTAAPWVDSNGWVVRLAAALHPQAAVWVDAAPKQSRLSSKSYVMAVADAAARGGRWIISLDAQLVSAIAAQEPGALETWNKVNRAADFFAAQETWSDYVPEAVIGVISDYSGRNEAFSHELVNLLDRTNEQYRIIPQVALPESSLSGLKAVICPDVGLPAPELQKPILAFVEGGGLLIAGPQWGRIVPSTPARKAEHPRYNLGVHGKGRVALANADLADAYRLANDSVVLVSHEYDLLRFWNGGAFGSFFTMATDRRRALVQMLFYVERGNLQHGGMGDEITVSVAGRYRSARIRTLDQSAPREVEMEPLNDAVELHFPAVSPYAAIELDDHEDSGARFGVFVTTGNGHARELHA